jgi:hypothetical protein
VAIPLLFEEPIDGHSKVAEDVGKGELAMAGEHFGLAIGEEEVYGSGVIIENGNGPYSDVQ